MKKRRIIKILLWTGTVTLGLVLALAIHIYIVMRPKAPDANTRVMARIDIHQPLTDTESDRITAWLYRQKGVDHVMCNPGTSIVVFTYSPLQANANKIVASFKTDLNYPKSVRYIPTEKDLQGSCPVASSSAMYKISTSIKHLIQ
ncbi:MAG: hypothetical protein J0H07_04090 [Sphingobacteriales bacterium]|nr:hypothetical protein [Sphingobacteriales bacterium]